MIAASQPPPELAPGGTVMTNLGGLKEVTNRPGVQTYPVRLQATVLYADYQWNQLFLHDSSGCHSIGPVGLTNDFPAGTLISLDGAIQITNGVARLVPPTRVVRLGRVPLPEAPPAGDFGPALDGNGRWVRLEGIIRNQRLERNHLELELSTTRGRISAVIRNRNRMPLEVVGLKVRALGILIPAVDSAPARYRLWVPTPECLGIDPSYVQPAPLSIRTAREKTLLGALAPMIRLQGRVVEQHLGESLVIQDDTGEIQLFSVNPSPLNLGARVTAKGFPELLSNGTLVLTNASCVRFPAADAPAEAIQTTLSTNSTASWVGLTNASQVRQLSRVEASKGLPARIQGVVTFYDASWNMLFVADDTSGIFIWLAESKPALQTGQSVEVRGVTGPGGYAPVIHAREIIGGPMGVRPPARAVSTEYLATGLEDSQSVKIRGVARGLTVEGGHLRINLLSAAGSLTRVIVSDYGNRPAPAYLNHAGLEISGVCGSEFSAEGHLQSATLWAASTNDITVLEPPSADPYALALDEIASVGRFLGPKTLPTQRRFQGVVTWSDPGKSFFIQDESGAIRVYDQGPNTFAPGTGVEVVGFPFRNNRAFSLVDATCRRLASNPPALNRPIDAPAPAIVGGEGMHGRLVRLHATLVEARASSNLWSAAMKAGDILFRVDCQGSALPGSIPAGARCELVGVCDFETLGRTDANTFVLLARDASDIRKLESPPLWRTEQVIGIFEAMAAVIFTGVLWVISLRRRVQRQTHHIRERLERETQLEARYRDLFENALDIIFLCDLQGRFLSLNKTAQAFFNRPMDPDQPLELRRLLTPESLPLLDQVVKRLLAGDTLPPVEFSVRRDHDGNSTLEATLRLIHHDGAQSGLECIARDITERKKLEDKLRQLSRATEQSPAAIFLTDTRGNLEYANPKFTKLTGYALTEIVGQNTRLLKSGETLPETYQDLWETILAGGEWQGELHDRKKNGEHFWVHASISPITNNEGVITHFLSVSEDITERRQLEERLRHSQKMESVGQLASGVAHDFNNILTVIQGHASLLLLEPEIAPGMADSARQIRDSAGRAADLTRQLLAFSRKQVMKAVVLDLNRLLANLSDMLRALLGEHIELRLRQERELPPIHADTTMMEQVVMNLAVNARDAMPRGGTLGIATFRHTVAPSPGPVSGDLPAGLYVGLRVTDTGCGMDEPTQSHIFEPFFTTKVMGKGTGLGLATVYGIVKQHGGAIGVTSQPGHGATFEVLLPACNGRVPAPAMPRLVPPRSGGGETILVVEDESALRVLVRTVLRRQGYQVVEASSGPEALRVWKQYPGDFALVLTDMVMPGGVSGRELATQLLAEKPQLKVIYSSGYSVELAGKDFVMRPQDRFLPKPYHPDTLARLVRDCLDDHPDTQGA